MSATAHGHQMAADVNIVFLVFVVWVVYSIISTLLKASRQARAQMQAATEATPVVQPMTAAAVRAALQRRLSTVLAAQQPTVVGRAATVAQAPRPSPPTPPAMASTPQMYQMPTFDDAIGRETMQTLGATSDLSASIVDRARLLSSGGYIAGLPPAAMAIVASAVIGPCAAHRGGGHQPEDW